MTVANTPVASNVPRWRERSAVVHIPRIAEDNKRFTSRIGNGLIGAPVRSVMATPTTRSLWPVLAFILALAACGSGAAPGQGNTATARETTPSAPAGSDDAAGGAGDAPEAVVGANLLPSVDVVDVATGDTFNLADQLGGGDTPILLWFWAPH